MDIVKGRLKIMTTQEYLKQVIRFENMIHLKREEILRLETMACSTPPTAMNPDKVQTSMVGDRMSDGVAKIVDAERDMSEMIKSYIAQRTAIVSQIEHIGDTKSYIVLMNRYVLGKSYCEIACEPHLKCSERRVKQLHRKALTDFEKKYGASYKDIEGEFQ